MTLMGVVAAVFIALPLYRDRKRLAPNATLIIVVVMAASAGLYAYQGSPDIPSGRGDDGHDIEQLVASLDAIASSTEFFMSSPMTAAGVVRVVTKPILTLSA